MKKTFAIFFIAIALCFVFSGCANLPEQLPATGNDSDITDIIPEHPSEGEDIESPPAVEQPDNEMITKMYITVNGNKKEVTLADNVAVSALVETLKQGDIVYTAADYGGFEKVGSLGYALPTADAQITTQAGDVVLYSGNQIVIFYGSNTWSYTRLGRINASVAELRALLCAGSGNVKITLSLK